jgi:glycosyltransferase involved in cell wall biosynthesis
MRVLFYVGDSSETGRARVFLMAAAGLARRGHDVTVAIRADGRIAEQVRRVDMHYVELPGDANVAVQSWALRDVLRDRSIEVGFAHTDDEQLVLSAAMRLAERGAVIRRVPSFAAPPAGGTSLARRLATAGVLVSTDAERAGLAAAWKVPPSVAPLGVELADVDEVPAAARAAIGAPAEGILIGCPFADSGRPRFANVLRAVSVLANRHIDLHVVVIGEDAGAEDLRLHASAVRMMSRFTFAPDVDTRTALRACDLVWIAADEDSGALAMLDAMALRLPIVAERTALTSHYIADGLTGVLLPNDGVEVMASLVASVIVHGDRRVAMGNAGRARVQREFPESAMIDGFERAALAAGDRTKWAVR